MGSRYGGLKQIDPVGPNGEIIIDYSIYDAIKAGFGKVVFVIRRDIEAEFREVIGSRFEGRIAVDYAYQELSLLPEGYTVPEGRTKPWGTAHAIMAAETIINEPFAAINADDFYGAAGFQTISEYLTEGDDTDNDYCMVGYVLRNTLSEHGTVSRGVCRTDENGFLAEITERTKIRKEGDAAHDEEADVALTGDEPVSMNLWGFKPTFFEHLNKHFSAFLESYGSELNSEYYIGTAITSLIEENTASIKVLTSADSWFGVTYPDDKPLVMASIKELIDSGKYPPLN